MPVSVKIQSPGPFLRSWRKACGSLESMNEESSQTRYPKTWILDGFMGNGRRFEKLRDRIRAEIGPAEIWHYQTSGLTPIDYLGRVFSDILSWERGPVYVVGYSMGGLISRVAVEQTRARIVKAVMLNVPHQGTRMAHLLPLPAVQQMRPGSRLLKRLARQDWNVPTLNVWCPGDAIVVPGSRARWDRARCQEVCRMPAHIWPIYSETWHQRICDFLRPG